MYVELYGAFKFKIIGTYLMACQKSQHVNWEGNYEISDQKLFKNQELWQGNLAKWTSLVLKSFAWWKALLKGNFVDWKKAFVMPSLISNRNFIWSVQIILQSSSKNSISHMLKMAEDLNRLTTEEHIGKENNTGNDFLWLLASLLGHGKKLEG